MRLTTLQIQNYRSFKEETIYIDNYTCLVGNNGAGKSTVLSALNIFFREKSSTTDVEHLSEEDFHNKDTSKPIKITATFEELSDAAKNDFAHYLRQDKLIISAKAEWSEEERSATVLQYGERLGIKEFGGFFEASNATEKKKIYSEFRKKHHDLPTATSGPKMEEALREFEQKSPDLCSQIESQDQFYGWTKGASLLVKHIQWVYVPAVKDASTEQNDGKNTAISKILDRTLRAKIDFSTPIGELKQNLESKYKDILEENQGTLSELGQTIQTRLQEWSTPDSKLQITWDYDSKKSLVIDNPFARISIGDSGFLGEVSRLGHGMQRSFLVALLQELATGGNDDSPKLILGFEEPELYQHPPQAQHLASVLENLSDPKSGNAQTIMTTHSPYFVSFHNFERIRMVRKSSTPSRSNVQQATVKSISNMIAEALGDICQHPSETIGRTMQVMQPSQRELFFCKVAVLVEGIEDVAYITTHLHLMNQWDNFRKFGCHFIVTGGKTNASRPLAIAKTLNIPTFLIFDSDGPKENDQHKKNNTCLLKLCGFENEDPLPTECLFKENVVMWKSTIGKVVKEDIEEQCWDTAFKNVKNDLNIPNDTTFSQKNSHAIAATLEKLYGDNKKSNSLEKLCTHLLEFAKEAVN